MPSQKIEPAIAEQRIRALGRELQKLKSMKETEPRTAEDIVRAADFAEKIEAIERERTQLGKQLLEGDRERAARRLADAEKLRQQAHADLGDLKSATAAFFAKFEKALAPLGDEFAELQAQSAALRKLDISVERPTRNAAISHGHLIAPSALEEILRGVFDEAFQKNATFPFPAAEKLSRLDRSVQPREATQ